MPPANINLTQLETFLWVASLRSFRKTAEKLNTTQPAISSRIAKLEETLGVRLFERDTSFIRLTTKGLELVPYAEKVLRSSTQLVDRIGYARNIAGTLRLGVSETIVHTWLKGFITGIGEKFPEIEISVAVNTTANLHKKLVERSLDFAFLLGPLADLRIENHDLLDFELIWVAAPSLGLSPNRRLTLNELTTQPLLAYAEETRPYVELKRALQKVVEQPPRIFPSSSLAAIIRMAVDGLGVAAIPRQVILPDLKDGRLQEIFCEWTPPRVKFTASFLDEPYNPVTEKVIRYAIELTRDYQRQIQD
ncbi:MAG: LysR family transcriptional regulator [Alphaproteobacteria bacterium]|nr:MAG: LysR family transcriptional regulator [Alphaproteobacteria bacterium]